MSRTLYYFAVGGTGGLSVEPLLHLCAAGLGPERLAVIMIDPDASNPALTRALQLVDSYQRVRQACGNPDHGFFRTELIRTERSQSVWSPLGRSENGGGIGAMSLEEYVQKPLMAGEVAVAGDLLNLLFSREQQTEELKEGFRGNPAIGSILMHGLRDAEIFKELLAVAGSDVESRFFATGSIFGGTGAAALPVIARLLFDEGIASERLGAAILTPYYALPQPSAEESRDGRLKPDSARFLLATKAALPTYVNANSQYGTLYVMGDEESLTRARPTFSAGGRDQLNDPHFIELFAALGALDFGNTSHISRDLLIRYATIEGSEPGWDSLTIGRNEELMAFIIATNFFLQYFGLNRAGPDEQRLATELERMPFVQELGFRGTFVREQADALNAIGEYCSAFWGWLWAVTHNYRPLRIVDFSAPSELRVPLPPTYASSMKSKVHLPRVDRCIAGHNVRRQKGILKRNDADTLTNLAEMFRWYNKVNTDDVSGVPGLLHYMSEGSKLFVRDWYSRAAEQAVVQ